LGEDGRNRIRTFLEEGGSFTGNCAGAWACSSNSSSYYRIWPGRSRGTGIRKTWTGHTIPEDSPLLQYYDFGGDHYLARVFHNRGPYGRAGTPGTEALASYDYSGTPDGELSTWAYKKDESSGRIVVCGSHPELAKSGEARDFHAAMFLYALDGLGEPRIKGKLALGQKRLMDKSTGDNDPDYARIGDKQYHHFTVQVPAGTRQLMIELDADDRYDLNLYANRRGLAFESQADYSSADGALSIRRPAPGTWYVGVECATTVTATGNGAHCSYTGDLTVLNGVAYGIGASCHPVPEAGDAVAAGH
jgi:hypothetical protein